MKTFTSIWLLFIITIFIIGFCTLSIEAKTYFNDGNIHVYTQENKVLITVKNITSICIKQGYTEGCNTITARDVGSLYGELVTVFIYDNEKHICSISTHLTDGTLIDITYGTRAEGNCKIVSAVIQAYDDTH